MLFEKTLEFEDLDSLSYSDWCDTVLEIYIFLLIAEK